MLNKLKKNTDLSSGLIQGGPRKDDCFHLGSTLYKVRINKSADFQGIVPLLEFNLRWKTTMEKWTVEQREV